MPTLHWKSQPTEVHDTCWWWIPFKSFSVTFDYSNLLVFFSTFISHSWRREGVCAHSGRQTRPKWFLVERYSKIWNFSFFQIFMDFHGFWLRFGHSARWNGAPMAVVAGKLAWNQLFWARLVIFSNLKAFERRITSHSGRKKCMIWSKFASFRLISAFFELENLDHAADERGEKSSIRIPGHHQVLNFENIARVAQKSILGAKWDSLADLSSGLGSWPIGQLICSFSRNLKNVHSE